MGIGDLSMKRMWVVGGVLGGLLLIGGCSSSAEPASPKAEVTTPAATTTKATTTKATTTTAAPTTTTVAPTTTTTVPPVTTAEQFIAPVPLAPAPEPAPESVRVPEPEAPPVRRAEPEPVVKEAPSANYANCAAVRAAGAAPIYRGDPGYSKKLDRDGDGVACE